MLFSGKDEVQLFRVIVVTFLLFAIVACGGTKIADTPSTSPSPKLNNFKAKITYENDRGVSMPHPYAEVFLHDSQWNVVTSQVVDVDGLVEFSRSEDSMPVSVVTYSLAPDHPSILTGEKTTEIVIKSYASVEMRDYSIISELTHPFTPESSDATPEECVSGDLYFDIPDDYFPVYIFGIIEEHIPLGEKDAIDFDVCKVDGEWPTLFIAFENNDVHRIATTITSFDELQLTGQQVVKVEHPDEKLSVPIRRPYQDLYYWYELDGKQVMPEQPVLGTSFSYYPTEPLLNQSVFVGRSTQEIDPFSFTGPDGTLIVVSRPLHYMVVYTESPQEFLDVATQTPVPEISDELSEFYSGNTFDFSEATDFPFHGFRNNAESDDIKLLHQHTGGISGSFPTLDVYKGYEQVFADLTLENPTRWYFYDYPQLSDKSETSIGTVAFGVHPTITENNYATHPLRHFELYGY